MANNKDKSATNQSAAQDQPANQADQANAPQEKPVEQSQSPDLPGYVAPQPITIVPPPVPATPEKPLDEAEEGGGKFIVNDRLVNTEGELINEKGELIEEDGTLKDEKKKDQPAQ